MPSSNDRPLAECSAELDVRAVDGGFEEEGPAEGLFVTWLPETRRPMLVKRLNCFEAAPPGLSRLANCSWETIGRASPDRIPVPGISPPCPGFASETFETLKCFLS